MPSITAPPGGRVPPPGSPQAQTRSMTTAAGFFLKKGLVLASDPLADAGLERG